MSYGFNSRYKKTNGFSPDEDEAQEHHCCHHPKEDPLKKALKNQDISTGSGSAHSDQYSYKSRYGQTSSSTDSDHHCCHHEEDLDTQTCNLQHKNAKERQEKSSDLIRKRLEEEQKKGS